MQIVWDALPSGILVSCLVCPPRAVLTWQHSDMLRYLLLALEGGIYSDTDTQVLKEPHRWGGGARLFRDGEGWMSDDQKMRILNGEDQDLVLGKPSLVVGIEADVGDRTDWAEWWPRPVSPGHPSMTVWLIPSASDSPVDDGCGTLPSCIALSTTSRHARHRPGRDVGARARGQGSGIQGRRRT